MRGLPSTGTMIRVGVSYTIRARQPWSLVRDWWGTPLGIRSVSPCFSVTQRPPARCSAVPEITCRYSAELGWMCSTLVWFGSRCTRPMVISAWGSIWPFISQRIEPHGYFSGSTVS